MTEPESCETSMARPRRSEARSWLGVVAAAWFTFAGLTLTLEYIDALPRPWSTTLRAVGGLTALATAIAILYDTWRDARNSQRYLQAYADLMRKGLAEVKGSYRVVPFEDEFVATCADHPFLSWSAPSAVEALHGLETLICETLADLATLEAGNAEEPQG